MPISRPCMVSSNAFRSSGLRSLISASFRWINREARRGHAGYGSSENPRLNVSSTQSVAFVKKGTSRDRGPELPPTRPLTAPRYFHVLAKPTGPICNLDCEYCFFLSKESLYPGDRFRMSEDLLEAYIRQVVE